MPDPLWINCPAPGSPPQYTAGELRQDMAAATTYDGRALGGRGGVRPGGTQWQVTLSATTLTVHAGVGFVDPALTTQQGPYWVALPADETHELTPAHATSPRKDLVIVRVYDDDEDSSGLRLARSEYLAGVAGPTPGEPAVPAGSIKLAVVDVPAQGGGSPVVTNTSPYAVAAGGVLPLRSATDEATLAPYEGQVAYRLDDAGGSGLRVYDGAAWDYARGPIVCTSTTRPAHRAGRQIYETDTGRVLVSNGTLWKFMGPTVSYHATITGADTTTSTTYVNLTTAGPTVSNVPLLPGQQCKVLVMCGIFMDVSPAGTRAYMGYAVSGPETVAPDDNDAVVTSLPSDIAPGAKESIFTATAGGNYTFQCKYKVAGAVQGNYDRRRILVTPQG